MRELEQLQEIAIKIIEEENFLASPKNLYQPIDYAMHQGGKRVRPLLALMAADLFLEILKRQNQ